MPRSSKPSHRGTAACAFAAALAAGCSGTISIAPAGGAAASGRRATSSNAGSTSSTGGKNAPSSGGQSADAAISGTGGGSSGMGGGGGRAGGAGQGGTRGASGAGGMGGGGMGTGGTASPPPRCTPTPGGPVFMPTGKTPALTSGTWMNISPPGLYRPRGSTPPYGCMDIHVDPCNTAVLYITSDSEGMWRSTDAGATWSKIGDLPDPVSPGVMQIDPGDPSHIYYIGGVRGNSLGFYVSHDSGAHWTQPPGFTAQANNSVGGWVNDVYDCKADPNDFNHVLLTFHSPWEFKSDAGVLESKDGGDTWIRHAPGAWGAGHSIFFLKDSSSWLLGTQTGGYFRTSDAGAHWTKVSDQLMQHGGVSALYSKAGVLYVGAVGHILRSTDDGVSFSLVGPNTPDGYYAIASDGAQLYAQAANTGANSTNMGQSYVVSPESDGTTWMPYNSQTFSDGPYRMAFDANKRILYSANWNDGVWALKVP